MTMRHALIAVLIATLATGCSGGGAAPDVTPSRTVAATPSAGAATANPGRSPAQLTEALACPMVIPVMDRAIDLIITFAGAEDLATLSKAEYARALRNLQEVAVTSPPTIRPHLDVIAGVLSELLTTLRRGGEVTVRQSAAGKAAMAVVEACR